MFSTITLKYNVETKSAIFVFLFINNVNWYIYTLYSWNKPSIVTTVEFVFSEQAYNEIRLIAK
jgi:hypothetical protein